MLGLQDPNMLVVSRPSSNNLFPGWGLTKVNLIEGDTHSHAKYFDWEFEILKYVACQNLAAHRDNFLRFNVLQISLLDDMRSREFVRIHDKCIRDVEFSPQGDPLILTTGLDKTLQLTSLQSNIVVQK